MILVVPLRCDIRMSQRPWATFCFIGAVFWQIILLNFFPDLRFDVRHLVNMQYDDPSFYYQFFLSIFRGASIFALAVLAIFGLILGPGIEERCGTPAVIATFLAGCIGSFLLARYNLIEWTADHWLGQDGILACIGLAYLKIWADEVIYLYFVFLFPYLFKGGKTTTAAAFIIFFYHLCITLSHLPPDMPDTPFATNGTIPIVWVFLYPFVFLTIFLIPSQLRPQSKESEAEA